MIQKHTPYHAIAALLMLGLGALSLPAGASAQTEDTLATLRGQVLSRSRAEPVEQAFVLLLVNGKGGLTDEEGRFSIPDVQAGQDTVQIRYFGFAPTNTLIELEAGHITEATFLLSQTVVEVAELKVEVRRLRGSKLRGFEERRRKGFGYFITPQQIERRRPRQTTDMLRGVPGVVVGPERAITQTQVLYTGGGATGQCEPAIYLDGQPVSEFYADDVPAPDLLAIEIYKGATQMPPQWARGSCGLLVIWTKEGPLQEEEP